MDAGGGDAVVGMARAGQRPPPLWPTGRAAVTVLAGLLAVIGPLVTVVVVTRSTALLEWLAADPRTPAVAAVHAAFAFAMAAAMIVTASRLGMLHGLMLHSIPARRLLAGVAWGVAIGALPTVLAVALLGPQPATMAPRQVLVDFAPAVVAVPLVEELVFRGVLLGWLTRLVGFVGAVVLTTVAFAAIHTGGSIVAGLLAGVVMCYLVRRTGSLWSSFALHAAHNLTVLLLAATPIPAG